MKQVEKPIVSPINRLGGKSRLRKEIIQRLPHDHLCYAEVFCGASWVYFAKPPSKVEVINDKDKELINLFRIVKAHPEELQRQLEYEFHSRDSFMQHRKADLETLTDIQRAVRFMYVILNSFAGKGGVYGYATKEPPPQKLYRAAFEDISARLKNTHVENLDFEDLIYRYDRDTTLFFCDPPYIELTGYTEKFKKDDHVRLSKALASIKGRFLLTINDHPLARSLYHDCKIETAETQYSCAKSKNKRVQELIITNY